VTIEFPEGAMVATYICDDYSAYIGGGMPCCGTPIMYERRYGPRVRWRVVPWAVECGGCGAFFSPDDWLAGYTIQRGFPVGGTPWVSWVPR